MSIKRAVFLPELRPYFLENLVEFAPLEIFWVKQMYMEGVELARDFGGFEQDRLSSPWQSFRVGLALDADELVMPEPFWFRQYPTAAPFLLGVRLGDLRKRKHTRIGTYCIDNALPEKLLKLPERIPAPVRTRLARLVSAPYIWMLDVFVFGTSGARKTYVETTKKDFHNAETVLPRPLPRPGWDAPKDRKKFAFVGSLRAEKGIELMLKAWEEIAKRRADLSLVIAGVGELAPMVRQWAQTQPTVTFIEGATRTEVFDILDTTGCHVQLSMPGVRSREQVGSSNLEALSCGHRLIVTTETGIADWLSELGHGVVSIHATPSEVADVIEQFADDPTWKTPDSTFGIEDGYTAAHRVLFDE
ncbi:glycosyltransferase [Corynebacterium sp. SCR221107]|uniref:glycosyltransferase n=1 Tax=Corynebacterium sp. SCR221107 TaxID=3017361 RepID=UPI0022EC4EEF|nr:glycosyltransferase [Corynebacterium sp. SCR221107]WBT08106.1 glycosyltransferase [Corynebacterium sp. SCR221107]